MQAGGSTALAAQQEVGLQAIYNVTWGRVRLDGEDLSRLELSCKFYC
jgi:hypothetical protein